MAEKKKKKFKFDTLTTLIFASFMLGIAYDCFRRYREAGDTVNLILCIVLAAAGVVVFAFSLSTTARKRRVQIITEIITREINDTEEAADAIESADEEALPAAMEKGEEMLSEVGRMFDIAAEQKAKIKNKEAIAEIDAPLEKLREAKQRLEKAMGK